MFDITHNFHCQTKYILSNVATRLLQRLSQKSSAQLSSNVMKTLCVSCKIVKLFSIFDVFCAFVGAFFINFPDKFVVFNLYISGILL